MKSKVLKSNLNLGKAGEKLTKTALCLAANVWGVCVTNIKKAKKEKIIKKIKFTNFVNFSPSYFEKIFFKNTS